MAKLKADFKRDWIVHLRSVMINTQGWAEAEVRSISDRNVACHYFDALRRRITPQSREIRIADDFQCPPECEAGWRVLQGKIDGGDDINAHRSRRHSSLYNPDGLLAEWGVHHFHLGVAADKKDPSYVERTGPLLYALVTDRIFFAINIYDHKSFEKSSILESIHRNWPDLIGQYRPKGVTGGKWDETQRRALRGKNVNVLVSTEDGTVYMPLSGGMMSSGMNAEAVRLADQAEAQLQWLQAEFETNKLDELLPILKQQGHAGDDEIEAELKIADFGLHVFFPKYLVQVNVAFSTDLVDSAA